MPMKKSASSRKALGSRKKSVKATGSKKKIAATEGKKAKEKLDPAAERFVRDLLIRGEAARPNSEGELPSGATHRIVEDSEEGELPKVEREAFSIS